MSFEEHGKLATLEALGCVVANVNRVVRVRGWSARQGSRAAGDSEEVIRDPRRSRLPSVRSLQALCDALDLEFYVGVRRELGTVDERRLEEALRDVASRGLPRPLNPSVWPPALRCASWRPDTALPWEMSLQRTGLRLAGVAACAAGRVSLGFL